MMRRWKQVGSVKLSLERVEGGHCRFDRASIHKTRRCLLLLANFLGVTQAQSIPQPLLPFFRGSSRIVREITEVVEACANHHRLEAYATLKDVRKYRADAYSPFSK